MEPAGWWELTDAGDGTRVKLVMAPKPGGLFKLMAPLMSRSMSKGNEKALAWLGERFTVLKDEALAAWQGISDALATGDSHTFILTVNTNTTSIAQFLQLQAVL